MTRAVEWTTSMQPPRAAIPSRVPLRRSLRVRTALAFSLFSIALILISGALFAHASLASARDQLREQAAGQLQLALAARAFGSPLPANASVDPKVAPTVVVGALHGSSITTFDDGRSMWAARRLTGDSVLSVRLSNAPIEQQWVELRQTFAIAAIGSGAASIVIGWLIAGSLTRRLRHVAATINQAVDGQTPEEPEGRDEVAVISQGIARSAENLRGRLDRERAFAADVAHDLKTPLTALVSASSLLDTSDDSNRVRHQIRRMQTLVEDLLELGRAEAGIDSVVMQTLDLSGLVAEVLDGVPENDDCVLSVVSSARVSVDSRRFARVLVNVIANAARHGRPPIEITVDGARIVVRDHGRGFPPAVLDAGPRRFARRGSTGGAGLGLAIAVQHITAMGQQLTLRNDENGGAVIELSLAPAPPVGSPGQLVG